MERFFFKNSLFKVFYRIFFENLQVSGILRDLMRWQFVSQYGPGKSGSEHRDILQKSEVRIEYELNPLRIAREIFWHVSKHRSFWHIVRKRMVSQRRSCAAWFGLSYLLRIATRSSGYSESQRCLQNHKIHPLFIAERKSCHTENYDAICSIVIIQKTQFFYQK
jgi:hypothetical protein